MLALLLEAREATALGEEVGVGPLQVPQGLLPRIRGCLQQSGGRWHGAPLDDELAQAGIAELLLDGLVTGRLERQCLVSNEAAGSGEAAHLTLLFAGWRKLVLYGLETLYVV